MIVSLRKEKYYILRLQIFLEICPQQLVLCPPNFRCFYLNCSSGRPYSRWMDFLQLLIIHITLHEQAGNWRLWETRLPTVLKHKRPPSLDCWVGQSTGRAPKWDSPFDPAPFSCADTQKLEKMGPSEHEPDVAQWMLPILSLQKKH
jgi:hypothetical protein